MRQTLHNIWRKSVPLNSTPPSFRRADMCSSDDVIVQHETVERLSSNSRIL
jgi:hypothetical protein